MLPTLGAANPRVYYNVIRENESPAYGQVFVQLQERTPPPVKIALIDELREKLRNVPGAVITVKNFEQGPPVDAPFSSRVAGENLDTLRQVAAQVENLVAEIDGTIYVENPISTIRTSLAVRINKDKAAALGIPIADSDRMVRLAIAGLNLGAFTAKSDGEDYNLTVSIPKAGAFSTLAAFQNLYINNVLGTAVPLSQVADIDFTPSPISFNTTIKTVLPV